MTEQTFDQNDDYNRRSLADNLLKLLNSNLDVSPIVIDGAWGTGKTIFCKKLMHEIESGDSFTPVYIDAYHADHVNEPLLTIISAILQLVPKNERAEKIKKIIPAIRYGLKAAMKAAAGHIFRQDADGMIAEFEDELKEASSTAIDISVEALLKDHIEANQNLDTLRNTLEDIAKIKPMVIFVDELDRCRPSYAVTMLEVIKHVFNVENVKFILINNMEQLRASINHCYGNSVDAQRYLDKFVKFTLSLPHEHPVTYDTYRKASLSHFENLVKNSPTLKASGLYKEGYLSILGRLIDINALSLREIETFIRYLEVYTVVSDGYFSNEKRYTEQGCVFIAIYLCVFEQKLASDIVSDKLDAKDILKVFGLENLKALRYGNSPPHYEIFLSILISTAKFNQGMQHGPEAQFDSVEKWKTLLMEFGRNAGYYENNEIRDQVRMVIRRLRTLSI